MSERERLLEEALKECVSLLEATAAVIFGVIPPQGVATMSKAAALLAVAEQRASNEPLSDAAKELLIDELLLASNAKSRAIREGSAADEEAADRNLLTCKKAVLVAMRAVIERAAQPPSVRHTLDCDMVKHPNCTRCSCGSGLVTEHDRSYAEGYSDAIKWQPIETAPKDGSEILLASVPQAFEGKPVSARVTVGHWTTDDECKVDTRRLWRPMPLPRIRIR